MVAAKPRSWGQLFHFRPTLDQPTRRMFSEQFSIFNGEWWLIAIHHSNWTVIEMRMNLMRLISLQARHQHCPRPKHQLGTASRIGQDWFASLGAMDRGVTQFRIVVPATYPVVVKDGTWWSEAAVEPLSAHGAMFPIWFAYQCAPQNSWQLMLGILEMLRSS